MNKVYVKSDFIISLNQLGTRSWLKGAMSRKIM